MLGDAGANALGAVLGTAYVARTGTFGRLAALAGLVALTAASEKVSFTQVIEKTPALRAIDRLGRLQPTAPPVMAAPPAAPPPADETATGHADTHAPASADTDTDAGTGTDTDTDTETDAGSEPPQDTAARRRPSPRPRRDG